MTEIGFSLEGKYDLPIEQVIQLLKKAGFCAVSPVWTPELGLNTLASCVLENGMKIQSLHAPHQGVPMLWKPDDPEAEPVQRNLLQCVDDCATHKIPVMVLHCWRGHNYTFPKEPLDYRFMDRLTEYAEKKGVAIAIENLEGEEYLQALMIRYQNKKHIGFCWDSGHDNCYPHRLDFLKAFGDRLIMTHLNDNMGMRDPCGMPTTKDDLHFLPFDGTVDWEDAILRLQGLPRQKILNFELKLHAKSADPGDHLYAGLSTEAFFLKAGAVARKIAQRYDALFR